MQIERGFAGGVAATLPVHLVAVTHVEHAAVVRFDGRESIVLHSAPRRFDISVPGPRYFSAHAHTARRPLCDWALLLRWNSSTAEVAVRQADLLRAFRR